MQSRIFRGLLVPLLAVSTLATSVATYETLREVVTYNSQTWQLAISFQAKFPSSTANTCAPDDIQLWCDTLSCSHILPSVCYSRAQAYPHLALR